MGGPPVHQHGPNEPSLDPLLDFARQYLDTELLVVFRAPPPPQTSKRWPPEWKMIVELRNKWPSHLQISINNCHLLIGQECESDPGRS